MRTSALWLATCVLAACLTACTPAAVPLAPAPAPTPTVTPRVSLPGDAAPHDALMEWWYYTGHLRDANERRYGFQFTIFQIQRADSPTGYLGNFAVTDVNRAVFSHQARAATGAVPTALDLDVQGWTLRREGESDVFSAAMVPRQGAEQPYALQLRGVDQKPPVLHHGGYIEYGDAGGSYYYSRTRIDVAGTLRTPAGEDVAVTGQAWMDHQWGNFIVPDQGGWDWYSLQLDDWTELMLYVLRDASGAASAVYGTVVDADGTSRELAPGSAELTATGQWVSPHTGATYPSGWRIDVPAERLSLMLDPVLQDQELHFPSFPSQPKYWEGAVALSGTRAGAPITGQGYVELTGYVP